MIEAGEFRAGEKHIGRGMDSTLHDAAGVAFLDLALSCAQLELAEFCHSRYVFICRQYRILYLPADAPQWKRHVSQIDWLGITSRAIRPCLGARFHMQITLLLHTRH
jgi:hypothetical protein